VHVYAVMVINVLMDFGTIPTVWYLCFSFFLYGTHKVELIYFALFLRVLSKFTRDILNFTIFLKIICDLNTDHPNLENGNTTTLR